MFFFSKCPKINFEFVVSRKCEEVYPPNASEFAYVTDNAYTKKQVLKIEDLLLQTLHFEVSTVTTHTFLLHYLKLAEVDETTEDLARVSCCLIVTSKTREGLA